MWNFLAQMEKGTHVFDWPFVNVPSVTFVRYHSHTVGSLSAPDMMSGHGCF